MIISSYANEKATVTTPIWNFHFVLVVIDLYGRDVADGWYRFIDCIFLLMIDGL